MADKTKKLLVMILAAVAVFTMVPVSPATKAEAATSDTQAMYRLYNPNSGEHFYTASETECGYLDSVGWNYEGIAWYAPESSSTPVYRLYNPNAGDHHYTTSADERDWLKSLGWSYEGVGWYSADSDGEVLYRLYNPNAATGSHHYTLSASERDNLVSLGWEFEGTAWYGSVHTHSYTITSTKKATCTSEGVTTYTCSCGSYYTITTPASHTWQDVTEQVLVDGGTYTKEEIVGYDSYFVCNCGLTWYSLDELEQHQQYNNTTKCGRYIIHKTAITETKTYENPDYYETVVTGQKCTVCGATK